VLSLTPDQFLPSSSLSSFSFLPLQRYVVLYGGSEQNFHYSFSFRANIFLFNENVLLLLSCFTISFPAIFCRPSKKKNQKLTNLNIPPTLPPHSFCWGEEKCDEQEFFHELQLFLALNRLLSCEFSLSLYTYFFTYFITYLSHNCQFIQRLTTNDTLILLSHLLTYCLLLFLYDKLQLIHSTLLTQMTRALESPCNDDRILVVRDEKISPNVSHNISVTSITIFMTNIKARTTFIIAREHYRARDVYQMSYK
jgi:hypothetical protein